MFGSLASCVARPKAYALAAFSLVSVNQTLCVLVGRFGTGSRAGTTLYGFEYAWPVAAAFSFELMGRLIWICAGASAVTRLAPLVRGRYLDLAKASCGRSARIAWPLARGLVVHAMLLWASALVPAGALCILFCGSEVSGLPSYAAKPLLFLAFIQPLALCIVASAVGAVALLASKSEIFGIAIGPVAYLLLGWMPALFSGDVPLLQWLLRPLVLPTTTSGLLVLAIGGLVTAAGAAFVVFLTVAAVPLGIVRKG